MKFFYWHLKKPDRYATHADHQDIQCMHNLMKMIYHQKQKYKIRWWCHSMYEEGWKVKTKKIINSKPIISIKFWFYCNISYNEIFKWRPYLTIFIIILKIEQLTLTIANKYFDDWNKWLLYVNKWLNIMNKRICIASIWKLNIMSTHHGII